jgi:predicted nucleic acid-binding protein
VLPFIDTSIFIDALRGHPSAGRLLEQFRHHGALQSSEVVRTELLIGMRPHEERGTEDLFRAVTWHPVDHAVARLAGELGRQWKPSHRHIDTSDFIIGATATLLGAQLVTKNLRHFPMFPDLTSPYEYS